MFIEVLQSLLDCVYAELRVKPGWYSVTPGPAALDECCDGQLWVTLAGLTPRYDRGCLNGWDMSVTVGLVRCIAVVNDRGVAPSMGQIAADAAQLAADAEDLRQALRCCPRTTPYVQRIQLGSYSVIDPQGGCAGGSWSLTLTVPDCGC